MTGEKPPPTTDDSDIIIEATKEFAHLTAAQTSKVNPPSESSGVVERGQRVAEADPYEVHWEGEDNDPLNPRSMNEARKWVIVSASLLCV